MKRYIERGDIYYVRFPKRLSRSEQAGTRPCVVISNERAIKTSPNVIVATGTSKIKRLDLPYHLLLPKLSGLPKRTMIEGECIYHVDKERLFSYRCHLDEELMKQVDRCVRAAVKREKHKRKWSGGNRRGVKGKKTGRSNWR